MVDVEHVSKGEQWIYGEKDEKVGYIPSSYIKVGVIDLNEEVKKRKSVGIRRSDLQL